MPTITDIYRLLFGRTAIQNGNVIDMAEHGRSGGVSDGTPFKSVQEIPNGMIIEEIGSYMYIGEAKPGTLTSASSWRIRRIETTGGLREIYFANGQDKFNQVWDDRASLTYS